MRKLYQVLIVIILSIVPILSFLFGIGYFDNDLKSTGSKGTLNYSTDVWFAEAERQMPMVVELMKCNLPMAEATNDARFSNSGIRIRWSCSGYCGINDLHFYETLSDGTVTAICADDFIEEGKKQKYSGGGFGTAIDDSLIEWSNESYFEEVNVTASITSPIITDELIIDKLDRIIELLEQQSIWKKLDLRWNDTGIDLCNGNVLEVQRFGFERYYKCTNIKYEGLD